MKLSSLGDPHCPSTIPSQASNPWKDPGAQAPEGLQEGFTETPASEFGFREGTGKRPSRNHNHSRMRVFKRQRLAGPPHGPGMWLA